MLNKETLKQLKEKLLTTKTQILADINDAQVNAQPVELDQQAVGRVSRIDAIQQQQMHLNSLNRMKNQLALIEAALSKIDQDDYGFCRHCEEPIELQRLLARPESPFCLNCAKKN